MKQKDISDYPLSKEEIDQLNNVIRSCETKVFYRILQLLQKLFKNTVKYLKDKEKYLK